jgi:hypothetical protein
MAKRQDADSSNIARHAYSERAKALYIEFRSGGHYSYEDVPLAVFNGFKHAPSLGQCFHGNIREVYSYKKLNDFAEFVQMTGDRSLVVSDPIMLDQVEIVGEDICLL